MWRLLPPVNKSFLPHSLRSAVILRCHEMFQRRFNVAQRRVVYMFPWPHLSEQKRVRW